MIYNDYIRFQKQLAAIETQTELTKIMIHNFPLWFLIKDSLDYFLLTRFGTSTISLIKKRRRFVTFLIKCLYYEAKFIFHKKKFVNNINAQKLLFILNTNFSYKDKKGVWIDPFWKETINNLKSDYDIFIIEYTKGEKSSLTSESVFHLGEYFIKNPLYNFNYYFLFKRKKIIIDQLNELDKLMYSFFKKKLIENDLFKLTHEFLSSKYIKIKINSFLNEFEKARNLLSIIKPKLVFITSVQGHHGIIAASNYHNIRVIEYQHGIIDSGHPAYNYSKLLKERKKAGIMVPDYLFLFGAFWKKLLLEGEFWDEDQLYIAGSSKYESTVTSYSSKEKWNGGLNILFTALDIVRDEMIDYFDKFLFLIEQNNTNIKLYIKLHPRETHTSKFYQYLLNKYENRCFLISNKQISIHDIFIDMDYHLTVCSAAIYESLEAGLPSATIHPLGLHYFKDLISDEGINQFQNPDQLFTHINELILNKSKYFALKEKTKKYKNYFFGNYDINKNINFVKEIAKDNFLSIPR